MFRPRPDFRASLKGHLSALDGAMVHLPVVQKKSACSPLKLFDKLKHGDRSAALCALSLVVKWIAKIFFIASRVTRPDLGT